VERASFAREKEVAGGWSEDPRGPREKAMSETKEAIYKNKRGASPMMPMPNV